MHLWWLNVEEIIQIIGHVDSRSQKEVAGEFSRLHTNSLPITQTSVRRLMTKNREKEQRKPPQRCADESTCCNVLVQTDPSLLKSLRLMSTEIHSTTTEFWNFRNTKVAPVRTEFAAVTKKKKAEQRVTNLWVGSESVPAKFRPCSYHFGGGG